MVADGESNGFFLAAPACDSALDVLGDWGSDRDWLAHLPSSPSVDHEARPHVPTSPLPTQDTRTQYRRKRESRDAKRAILLQQVEELTQALETERRRLRTRESPLTGDARALSCEWSAMATRQRRQRRVAEERQRVLQELYESQVGVAYQIDRLLQKALRIGECLASPTTKVTVTIAEYGGPALGISSHVAYLERLLTQAHCVTGSGIFAQRQGREFREVGVRDAGDEGIQVEFAAEFALPFSAARVADVIWAESTHMEHVGRQVDYEHALWNSSVLVSSFVSTPDGSDSAGSNHGQAVDGITHGQTALRRFGQARDGSIWLLSMNHARIFNTDGTTAGFMKGDGWIRVEPVKRSGGPHTWEMCRVKWCHRVRGRPLGHDTSSQDERARWAYRAVTAKMRTQWERDFEATLQALENILVIESSEKNSGTLHR